jgi:hypothetical protein
LERESKAKSEAARNERELLFEERDNARQRYLKEIFDVRRKLIEAETENEKLRREIDSKS